MQVAWTAALGGQLTWLLKQTPGVRQCQLHPPPHAAGPRSETCMCRAPLHRSDWSLRSAEVPLDAGSGCEVVPQDLPPHAATPLQNPACAEHHCTEVAGHFVQLQCL
eukprot:1159169-Pelagomonas_calceolata.AAC.1